MVESLPRLPELGAPSVDSHAHLDMLEDPAAALIRASRAGIALIATVVDLTEQPEKTLDGLPEWLERADEALEPEGLRVPEVRLILGWHPHNARDGDLELLARLRDMVADPLVGALGELGLDFHYDHSPRADQRMWFRKHLELAHEIGLPVQIHLREAHDEGAAVLAECGVPAAGCVIHCFTEGPELAQRFIQMGCHVSFAGPVTFKNAGLIREAARVVPLERLLIETDCPFLAPHPYRGRRNEPAFAVLNAAAVAEAKGLPYETVATAALSNTRALLSRSGVR
ncbi:MAG: TatD family deoxyribonuclease [Actinobacteria bacterium]|nr:TatD family deoxyribonuclease [Actinomycetota bacterium]